MENNLCLGLKCISQGIEIQNRASAKINSSNTNLAESCTELKKSEILTKAGCKIVEEEKENTNKLINIMV
jgi:hypothetical protein